MFGYTAGRWDFKAGHGSEIMWPRKANETYDKSLQLGPDTGYRLDPKHLTVVRTLAGRGTRIRGFDQHRLVLLERSLDAESARLKLANVPRYKLKPEGHHRAVRSTEQTDLVDALERTRSAWVIADWGLGKDGFLATSLEQLGGKLVLADVFRLQCGGVEDCEALQAAAEVQFGMSLQEFLAGAAALPISALILDDLSLAMTSADRRQVLEEFISPIHDFCPALKLILVARQSPGGIELGKRWSFALWRSRKSPATCVITRRHIRA